MNALDQNAAISARQVAAFKAGAAHDGKSYLAYLTRSQTFGQLPGPSMAMGYPEADRITTWTGDLLATVTRIKSRRERRGYMTDTRGSFWARGIDGKLYHGRHNGYGMYCRMRLAKEQPCVA